MPIFWAQPFWPSFPPIFVGEMDYYLTTTIIVVGEVGDPVPNLWDVWFFGGGETIISHITGSGTGYFTPYGESLGLGISGDPAKVKLNQIGISKPPDHPQIDPEYDPYNMWPVEIVFFH